MLTGTNLKSAKALNHRIVMETIRLHAPISRAEIARQTSLTPQTISNIVAELIEQNLVREAGKRQQGRGAPSIALGINPEGVYSIGLDLDRDHLTGVLVDLSGKVRQQIQHRLSFPSPEESVDLMADTIHELVDEENLSVDEVSGIGVGLPGPIKIHREENETTTVNPEAFPGWENVPIIDMLREYVSRPILLRNNATAAAVGEQWYGVGRSVSSFFYLLFGIGLGGGIVIDGHPYEGSTGNAGELGYVPTVHHDPSPDENATATRPMHLGEHYHLPDLYDRLQQEGIDAQKPRDLATPFKEESPIILGWLEKLTKRLAPILVSVEYLIDPEVIVFGGRLPSPLIEALISRLNDELPTLRMGGKSEVPELRKASAGVHVAARGVAILPIYDLFAPSPDLMFKERRSQKSTAGVRS